MKTKGRKIVYVIHHFNNGYYVTCRPKNIYKI